MTVKKPIKTLKKAGRKTAYKVSYCLQVEKLSRLGIVDADMAEIIGVKPSTFSEWKAKYPAFSEAIKRGKTESDANVANKLYNRANGYEKEVEEAFVINGQVVKTKVKKYFPVDTTACIFWLKNRKPDTWRDKTEIAHDVKGFELTIKQVGNED